MPLHYMVLTQNTVVSKSQKAALVPWGSCMSGWSNLVSRVCETGNYIYSWSFCRTRSVLWFLSQYFNLFLFMFSVLQPVQPTLLIQCLTVRLRTAQTSRRTPCNLPPSRSLTLPLPAQTTSPSQHTTRTLLHRRPRLDKFPQC